MASEVSQRVLVGTFRPENAGWIRGRKLYNLPLPEAGAGAFHRAITRVVLVAEGERPLARAARFREVVDGAWLAARGYRVAPRGRAHGERYALYELTGRELGLARVLRDPAAEVFVATAECPQARIDAAFYERDYPATRGKSTRHLFDTLRPYFGGGRSATAFDPRQGEFINAFMVDQISKHRFTAVELFAGAGGLSIGLENAGINVVIANEIMPDFAATLAANHPHTKVINEDIHKIDFRKELSELGLKSVDVLSGGPPCQGFSTIGLCRNIYCQNEFAA